MTGARLDGDSKVRGAIAEATSAGRQALAAFVTAGFPSKDGFLDLVVRLADEAEVVEVGVPFSDPMADGVTIQRSSRAALEAGVDLRWILESLGSVRPAAPVILMSYLNPLLSLGAALADTAAAAGVSGFIVPDLPLEESGELRHRLDKAGLALVQLVTPVTPGPRLRRLCAASRGFVYAVTSTGTTGGAGAAARPTDDYFRRVRDASALPVLAGFGIRTAKQLQELRGLTDGAVVGSALIEELELGRDPVAFLRALRTPSPESPTPRRVGP